MKFKYLFLSLVIVLAFSCDNDDYELVQVATPQLMSKSDFRNSVEITPAKSVKESGKIYAYKNYIFVNDVNKGIHVIDNSNPENPIAIKYINIPRNEDISVKDDYLYADSATDLLVFDLSDINNISLVERLEDVFEVYNYDYPVDAESFNFDEYNYETDIIVGWTVATERQRKKEYNDMVFDGVALNSSESAIGTGGSLARFQIVDKYLYTVGSASMTIFDIQNLAEPVLANTQYSGWNIETMFQADGYLYLGSTNGMYIYSLENPSYPEYVSEFTHWEGCDPVVVDGDFAYLTLRGGNLCGQQESVLEVIDISDKTNPTLQKQYALDNPYGLGIKNNTLFVCDGTSGLKLFDKEDPLNISMVKQFKNIQSKDVIPLENTLLMIGDNTLYQFVYEGNDVKQISAYSLN